MRRTACLLVALALLSGCWSRREITETAFAGMMAVDWVEGRYRITLSVLLAMGGGPGQGAGGGGKVAADKPVWTIRADAMALDEAIGRLERMAPRRLFLAHVRSIIFGEALARRGIRPVLDFLSRTVEIRPTAWIGVAPGLAGDLLEARPIQESYPANGPLGYHDLIERRSLAPAQRLAKVVATLAEEGVDLAVSVLQPADPGGDPTSVPADGAPREVLAGGAAVFRGDRLVAWLDPEAARGMLWATGRAALGPVSMLCPEGEGHAVFRLRDNETRAQVRRQGAAVTARIRIRVVADANEVQCREGPRTRADLDRLEAALAAEVRREVEAALAVVREHGADIFGLGQTLYRRAPADYRALQATWPRVLARMPVEIAVKAQIARVGQLYGVIPSVPGEADQAP